MDEEKVAPEFDLKQLLAAEQKQRVEDAAKQITAILDKFRVELGVFAVSPKTKTVLPIVEVLPSGWAPMVRPVAVE